MAKKVSAQIKGAEVIEDTKVTPTVDAITDEQSVEQEVKVVVEGQPKGKKLRFLPGFINEESVAKARPIGIKALKTLAFIGTFYAGWKLKEHLVGGDDVDQDTDYESFDETQELIDAEFTVVDSEE
ncbi:MAG: hypothetical protein EOM34_17255 [Clostridia bacterium]|nr:hypothetical protein [Clostridia bacterium]